MRNYWLKHIFSVMLILVVLRFVCPLQAVCEYTETIFSEEELNYIQSSHELKVGYVCDRKPLSFQGENGQLEGISREIFDKISEISGLKFNYVELPAGSVTYDYLLSEGFDFVTSVEYNEENQKARGILISNPYLSSKKVIVAKNNFQFNMNDHLNVAISTGSQTIRKVLSNYYPNFELIDYPTTEDCFNAVNKGEVDLLIQNQYVVEYWLYKPSYNNLKVIPIIEMNDQFCFSAVTPLNWGDNAVWHEKELQISIINKSIGQMSDGEVAGYIITSIMDNMYHYTYKDFLYQYRYTLIALGIALVLIGVLLYINMQIRIRSIHDRADAKAKGEFLSTMSHEIRTPLNGLIGLNYMMSQSLYNKQRLADYLEQSSSVAQYLLSLVDNILDMSKLQENKMELNHKPVNLFLLFSTIETMQRDGMEEKCICFHTDIDLPYPVILGDELRIQQILVNILDNARKYTPRNGDVCLKIRQLQTAEQKIQTTIDVIDNGQGMSEEFQKKIFEPFTQERDTVSHGNQGTGLGMAICSLLAKSIGGSLSVKSHLNQGSCFTFVFTAESAVLPEETSPPEENTIPEQKKTRILIAEDNELNAQILIELLTEIGFEVSHAVNGKIAVEMFNASAVNEYEVILMDILMPEMNGLEATKAIRSLNRSDAAKVKIIACTANSFQEDRDNALSSGMNDFIPKPIDIPLLLQKIKEE